MRTQSSAHCMLIPHTSAYSPQHVDQWRGRSSPIILITSRNTQDPRPTGSHKHTQNNLKRRFKLPITKQFVVLCCVKLWMGCYFMGSDHQIFYKSSSSSASGKAVCEAICSSCSYFCARLGSIWTSGGSRAGISTNSRLGSPVSLRASHRNGF